MNKKLLALAIGAAVAMPVVALAEGPTLYGQLDVSLNNARTVTGAAAKTDIWSIANNASRLGVKGTADTGVDGLKGIYYAEFGLNVDDGTASAPLASPISQRNIYAGLKGGFGSVVMGNTDTPTKLVQGKVDQFNDTVADIQAYTTGEKRAPNSLIYATPKFGDAFTATVALLQSELNDDNVGEAVSASFVYEQDALYAGVGLDKQVPTTTVALGGFDSGAGVEVVPTATGEVDIVRAVVGYNTDGFEVGFLYQTAEQVDPTAAAGNGDTTMVLGAAFKTGDMKIKAQYGQTEGDASGVVETMIALGADYSVGKATTVYGLLALNEDDKVAALESQTFAFGIKQKF